jgi:glycosyltransferase involved in cell wall biosynthesis
MKLKLRIGILGTRGVPNHYGGFECFAEHLSDGLVQKGHEVIVYNSHNHPNQQSTWKGVQIVHCWDPEYLMGSFGQFIYDFNCITDARKRKLDVLLFLGYTSSSIWSWLTPRKPVIIYNMDGMEWKRSKYSKNTQRFLKYAEKWAIQCSDFIVADSKYIQSYLDEKYKVAPEYIAYGADLFEQPDESVLNHYHLQKHAYNMLMARMEPENNIEMILDGYLQSGSPLDFIVVGNTGNTFGTYLVNKFSHDKRIRFPGAIFNQQHVSNLIHFSNLYFHGHSVGGTNPSLLEAMGSQALIVAQDNIFNRSVLTDNAFYFTTAEEVTAYANTLTRDAGKQAMIRANGETIGKQYSWKKVIDEYETFFMSCYRQKIVVGNGKAVKQPC